MKCVIVIASGPDVKSGPHGSILFNSLRSKIITPIAARGEAVSFLLLGSLIKDVVGTYQDTSMIKGTENLNR